MGVVSSYQITHLGSDLDHTTNCLWGCSECSCLFFPLLLPSLSFTLGENPEFGLGKWELLQLVGYIELCYL